MRYHGAVVSNMHDCDVATNLAMVRLRHRFKTCLLEGRAPNGSRSGSNRVFHVTTTNGTCFFQKQRSHTSLPVMQRMHETPLLQKRPSTPRAQIRTRLIRGTPFEVHCSKPMPQTNHRQNHCNILVMHVGDDSGMIAHVLRALLDSGTCARRPTRVSTFFQEMFHDNATRQRVGHAHEVKIACARGTYTCRPQLLEARLTTSNLRRRHRHRRHRRCRPPSSSSSSLPAAPPARTMVYKSCVFVHVVQVIVAVAVVALVVVVVVMSSPALGRPNAPGGGFLLRGPMPA